MEPKPVGSYPKTGIDVLVVGTGFAGLTAALECTRKGHNVTVLERSSGLNMTGDMYFMGLSGSRFFKHWPEIVAQFDKISLQNAWISTYKHTGELMLAPLKVSARLQAAGLDPNTPPGNFQMRPMVYKMLLEQVEQLGIKIEFNQKVVEYFEDADTEKGGVVTESGRRLEADLVIAADGVGSKSQILVGGQVRASPSGRAMWRAAFPIENLDKDPKVKEFFDLMNGKDPIIRTFLGQASYVTGSEVESWNNTIDPEEVLTGMDAIPGPQKWGDIFKGLIKCTPADTIVNFNLLWRNSQPKWASPLARVVQIGDAAHSYLPSSSTGATQAFEDAVSLASCLQIGGKANIPQSVRVHVRLRFVRTSCAQKLGFSNAELLQETDWEKLKLDPKLANPKLPKWIWSHDCELHAYENYNKAAEALEMGIPIGEEDNIPPNYPPGYKYKPWNIEEIMEDKRHGRQVNLGSGNWD